jgi:hypothetical protein
VKTVQLVGGETVLVDDLTMQICHNGNGNFTVADERVTLSESNKRVKYVGIFSCTDLLLNGVA